jgi:hypothetical protein
MKLASVRPNDLAVIRDGEMVLVGKELTRAGLLPEGATMIDLITRYDQL